MVSRQQYGTAPRCLRTSVAQEQKNCREYGLIRGFFEWITAEIPAVKGIYLLLYCPVSD
jgi:hypothetical protein